MTPRLGGKPRLAAVALGAVALLAATGSTAPVISLVATGAPRTLGEPVAVPLAAATLVAATSFGATTEVTAWSQTPGAGTPAPQPVLPAGYTRSYDAAAATLPGGAGVLVVGAAPAGGCISGGSVFLARVSRRGTVGTPVAVSDQRGQPVFDDRPAVAVGARGTVYVGWSQGPAADDCQDVGVADRPMIALSRDGGRTFGPALAVPAPATGADFGVRLTPAGAGRLAVSWTVVTDGRSDMEVSVLGADGHLGPARSVVQGVLPPATLPGASFLNFPAGDLVALGGGRYAAVEPDWVNAQSVLQVATGTLSGPWHPVEVAAPPGSDLFLPALAGQPDGTVRLVAAEHTRSGDGVGYLSALATAPHGSAPQVGPWSQAVPVLAGPGYFEIGEEQFLVPTEHHLLAAVVAAGAAGASVQTVRWSLPAAPPTASPSPSAATRLTAPASNPAASNPAAAPAASQGGGLSPGLLAAAGFVVVLALAARARHRYRR